MKYYVMTKGGRAPQFKHEDLDSARTEAKRLNSNLGLEVEILAIVGVVKTKEVPVTKTVQDVEIFINEGEDLPF